MGMLHRPPRGEEELKQAARWLAYEWAMLSLAPKGRWVADPGWAVHGQVGQQHWRQACVGSVATEVELLHLRNLFDFLCSAPQEDDLSALDFLPDDHERTIWALSDWCPTLRSHMKYINKMLMHVSWRRGRLKEQAPPNGWNDWKPKYREEVAAALKALGERFDPGLRGKLQAHVLNAQGADDNGAYPGIDLPLVT